MQLILNLYAIRSNKLKSHRNISCVSRNVFMYAFIWLCWCCGGDVRDIPRMCNQYPNNNKDDDT